LLGSDLDGEICAEGGGSTGLAVRKPADPSAWWDRSWNPLSGCRAVSPGCQNCYAAQIAGTKTFKWLHRGVTVQRGTKRIFNGTTRVGPPWHKVWSGPLQKPSVKRPKLGPGQPNLVFVGDMSDLFHKGHPTSAIDRVVATIAFSDHIGLLLTKRTARMAAYFAAQSPSTVLRWQPKLWLGFSAERQKEFDERWADMRPLADAGWLIFVSIAPLIEPVLLPPDFLTLGDRAWVIVAGEQGPHADCRDLDPNWARQVRDQCAAAHIPFFMKQMAKGEPIPPDLFFREFPSSQ